MAEEPAVAEFSCNLLAVLVTNVRDDDTRPKARAELRLGLARSSGAPRDDHNLPCEDPVPIHVDSLLRRHQSSARMVALKRANAPRRKSAAARRRRDPSTSSDRDAMRA